jgi:hypothetical protein
LTWFRVDDGFSDHAKVHALQESRHWKGALALWTLAGSWCAKHEKDGFVPEQTVRRLGGLKHEAEALVECGLWERVDGGYRYHGWAERNPLKADLEAKREQTRKRVSDWRTNKAVRVCNSVTREYANAAVTPPPSQTLPDPSQTQERESAREDAEARFKTVRSLVRVGFSRRWQEARQPGTWPLATSPDVDAVASWVLSVEGHEPEAVVEQLLNAFFADPWVRSNHYPVGNLARHAAKYFQPREAPPRASRTGGVRTAKAVRAEAAAALLAQDMAAVKRLNAEADELERAEGARRARA